MGVTGLWRLIEPAGMPVPVETLENKVLAVDISIWLHQMVKGYQDAKGAPLPNAHLMGLFQRVCKLLYFRVKPVFVFDGGFPDLKKETIAKRQDNKSKYNSESERIKRELTLLLSKKTAISSLLGKQISPRRDSSDVAAQDDLFKLPALPARQEDSESESEDETSSGSIVDLHSVDVESENFKSLPVKEKYDLLIELKETRKMNSWGKIHELPKKSDNFSDFQMQRLLKRRKVQECLQETEKEMGDTGMSLNELESLLNEEGIDTKIDTLHTRRIASNNTTRFVLINDVKKALSEAKKKKEAESNSKQMCTNVKEKSDGNEEKSSNRDELEDDLQRAIKMSLECVEDPDNSACTSKTDDSWTSVLTDSDSYNDSEEEDGFDQPDMTSAKAYIMQYSDFTHKVIDDMVTSKNKHKSKAQNVDIVLEELSKEKSIIIDKIDVSSDEEFIIESSKKVKEEIKATPSDDEGIEDINNTTQLSVVCIEKSLENVITVDSSTEDDTEQNLNINIKNKKESDSSDSEDFEDVPDVDSVANKAVVELTLKTDKMFDDDIFADVFTTKIANLKNDEIVKPILGQSTENITLNEKTHTMKKSITETPKLNLVNKKPNEQMYENSVDAIKTKDRCLSDSFYSNKDVSLKTDSDIVTPAPIEDKTKDTDKTNNVNSENEISNETISKNFPSENLNSIVEEIETEERQLLHEKGKLDRIGRNITEQMTKEAQELLQIFGIPYIVAPMEAEAQCAFLENVNLTDGTITDDSDIWLFGGKTVYKNFFNQKKHVIQFLSGRIEKSFNLSREQLVLLALLVGSDYTTGLTGVGPVTALEILASFPFNKRLFINESTEQGRYQQVVTGLQEFKSWVRAGKRTDNITLKKKLKNVNVTDDFPSIRVVQAYLDPNVEKSKEKFTWGEIDITILRDYAKAKFGWSQSKLDEIINPVLSRMLDRKKQKNIHNYFKKKVEYQSLEDRMSKRVKAAIRKMGPEAPLEDTVVTEEKKKIRKRKPNNTEASTSNVQDQTSINVPSKAKQKKNDEEKVLKNLGIKVVSKIQDDGKSTIEINIPKLDRVQEVIPQREKEKQCLLQNKLKAIEIFRTTKLDRKSKVTKKRIILPKEKANLSEDSDSV
ncbi:DNA excision repair protein ERCC-5 [Achroia grisella]|uniref:DNA excision repair protein ERCC-5 n=1 Tax=Achroia grisella TaxID=688607 RepID=UPI0027D3309F|nr:DNA excision repair protein ERCC-5 [Achroia grisella]